MAERASYLPVSLLVSGQRVVVLGSHDEAADKTRRALRAGARVVLIHPGPLHGTLEAAARRGQLLWFARRWRAEDFVAARLVVLCEPEPEQTTQAEQLWRLRRRHGFLLNAIDKPEYCDVAQMAVSEAGPIQVSLSSSGQSPAILKRMRQSLDQALDDKFVNFARVIADLRASMQTVGAVERRARLAEALEGFEMHVRFRYPSWVESGGYEFEGRAHAEEGVPVSQRGMQGDGHEAS